MQNRGSSARAEASSGQKVSRTMRPRPPTPSALISSPAVDPRGRLSSGAHRGDLLALPHVPPWSAPATTLASPVSPLPPAIASFSPAVPAARSSSGPPSPAAAWPARASFTTLPPPHAPLAIATSPSLLATTQASSTPLASFLSPAAFPLA